jgi:predicted nucleic acid-binding Zn finger protein
LRPIVFFLSKSGTYVLFTIGGTNVALFVIGGTNDFVIEGGTNVGGTNIGGTYVGGTKVAASHLSFVMRLIVNVLKKHYSHILF